MARGGASPRYLATSNGAGHLVYVNKATLFAIRFDLDTLTTRGTAVPVLDDVAHERVGGGGQFDVSRTGTLVYRRAIGGAVRADNAAMGGCHRQEGAAAGQAWRLSGSQPVTGRHAGRAGGHRTEEVEDIWVYDIAAGRHDALDVRRRLYRFPRGARTAATSSSRPLAMASSRLVRMAPASRKR